jgi:hypothetical protein
MRTMSETDGRTPRIAVWGFGFSLAGCVLGLGSFLGFALMMRSEVGNPLVAPWGLLSSPGLVLSLVGRRAARKRQAPRQWAKAGIVLGIVGTEILVLYVAWLVIFVQGLGGGE